MYVLAYYNVGSTVLVLVIIALVIAAGFYIRSRQKRGSLKLATERDEEESIPLSKSVGGSGDVERGGYTPVGESDAAQGRERRAPNGNGKGKERAIDSQTEEEPKGSAIFDVGDSDDEDEGHKSR